MGGYYEEDTVDDLLTQLKVEGGDLNLKNMVMQMGPVLEKNPEIYKSFGVYWWAVKIAFLKYYENQSAWFMNQSIDGEMLETAWHGNLFRTVFAGLYYHQNQISYNDVHEYYDNDGEDQTYVLFDDGAGF